MPKKAKLQGKAQSVVVTAVFCNERKVCRAERVMPCKVLGFLRKRKQLGALRWGEELASRHGCPPGKTSGYTEAEN